jgi:hypothetical protein
LYLQNQGNLCHFSTRNSSYCPNNHVLIFSARKKLDWSDLIGLCGKLGYCVYLWLLFFKDLHWKLEEFDYIKKSIAYRKCYLKNPKFPSMEKYEKKFWNGSIIFNMYVHISNVSKICIKKFVHYIKQIHVCTICWKFQILEVIISIKNIIFIKKYIQCSLGGSFGRY